MDGRPTPFASGGFATVLDHAAFAKLRDFAGREPEFAQDLVGVLAEKRRRAAVRDGRF